MHKFLISHLPSFLPDSISDSQYFILSINISILFLLPYSCFNLLNGRKYVGQESPAEDKFVEKNRQIIKFQRTWQMPQILGPVQNVQQSRLTNAWQPLPEQDVKNVEQFIHFRSCDFRTAVAFQKCKLQPFEKLHIDFWLNQSSGILNKKYRRRQWKHRRRRISHLRIWFSILIP